MEFSLPSDLWLFISLLSSRIMPESTKPNFPPYTPPTEGLLLYLPASWVPFAELIRLHKPAAIINVYFPYLFGSLFAACLADPIPSPYGLSVLNVVLFVISFMLRSVGCTWNDIIDRDLDMHVARCSIRPVARGAISPLMGGVFMIFQYIILFAFVLLTSPDILLWLAPVIILGTFYPFAKRITNYAQVVLGITCALGVPAGCAIMGIRPWDMALSTSAIALYSLSVSYLVWTVIYDTIYAFQDVRDDEKAGIKAMSVRHQNHMIPLLFVLSIAQVSMMAATGILISAGRTYYFGVMGTATCLVRMLLVIDLDSPQSCWWWFKYGSVLVGGCITLSLEGEYLGRYWSRF